MTLLGKVLVFINLAISVMMAAGAFALYTNRIDWSDRPAKGDSPAGVLAERQAAVKALWDGVGGAAKPGETSSPYLSAEYGWMKERANLLEQESYRTADRRWFVLEVQKLRSSDKPVQAVVFNQSVPVLDPKNPRLPQLADAKDRAGNPLYALDAYVRQSEVVNKNTLAALEQYDKLVKEDTELTAKLTGGPNNSPKGLQQRLKEERIKREGVITEDKLVRPQLVNVAVESELVLKRGKALDARIEELKKTGVATTDNPR